MRILLINPYIYDFTASARAGNSHAAPATRDRFAAEILTACALVGYSRYVEVCAGTGVLYEMWESPGGSDPLEPVQEPTIR